MAGGKWQPSENYNLDEGAIESMEDQEHYKYLGYLQSGPIDQKLCKRLLMDRYTQRLKAILKTELVGKNKVRATCTYAIPVLTYSYGILAWTDTELQNLDRLTRKTFTKYRAHHPRSAVERFHLPRHQGGRGIPRASDLHQRQVENLRNYFYSKREDSEIHMAVTRNDDVTPLKMKREHDGGLVRRGTQADMVQQWKQKPLHGRYPTLLEDPHIDERATFAWLTRGDLYAESEGFIFSMQDQVVATKSYRKHILKDPNMPNAKCRVCGQKDETIDHLMGSCTVLAPKEYTDRHNNVAKILHQKLCELHEIEVEKVPYYKYSPQKAIVTPLYKILWDWEVPTDKTISANVPDIVLVDILKQHTYIIDVAVPLPHNIGSKHQEKISKYIPLADEIKKLWHQQKVTIIPIVVGATGEIPHTIYDGLGTLGLKRDMYLQLQKAVLLSTCSIVRRVIGEDD
ncbi:hypothetical protein MML48_1g01499 [Holotrichia oblita]|uniref:Uncharacterized protein n=1 Tax=Holotrichia oblita TaxID=644536 RepID=A0ACB9TRX2_HOLOL|nr:hypothetical protein MML48_1g01499 [Holotrichia oblita]